MICTLSVCSSLRRLLLSAFFITAIACVPSASCHAGDHGPAGFGYAEVKGKARALAETPYRSHEGELPEAVQSLSWDDYQQLKYKKDHALWTDDESRFRAELFHLGLFFRTPVAIYELANGKVREMEYDPGMFEYGKTGLHGDDLPKDLGFAGFRLQYHKDWERDVVAFLGASYFRAVGGAMQYGLSARGLAVDTALPRPEEFPMFTHYWLQKPAPGSDTVTVYALLDSPSVTGAYRFDITPGQTLVMRVDAAIYPRKPIERLGIAPLTSMYMVGENDRRMDYDWRPEIHDSDGLAMHTGAGEWIWRPLVNPRTLRFNAYSDNNPRGFGLLQRDLKFDHYQDDGVFYDKRPSVWVEPAGNWGAGSVQLVEIPTIDETFDNIVALWNPAQPVEPGQELLYSYTLHWGTTPPTPPRLAHTVDTFTGLGGVIGKKREYYSKRFAVDFAGGELADLDADTEVTPVITASAGRVEVTSARPLHAIAGYRAMFDIVPPEDTHHNADEPINLRLYLEADGKPLSETWMYQWTPPPVAERKLYNAE